MLRNTEAGRAIYTNPVLGLRQGMKLKDDLAGLQAKLSQSQNKATKWKAAHKDLLDQNILHKRPSGRSSLESPPG